MDRETLAIVQEVSEWCGPMPDVEVDEDMQALIGSQVEEMFKRSADRAKQLRRLSYTKYLQTDWWHELRDMAKALAEHRCRGCNAPDNLEVHHRSYEHLGTHDEAGDLVVLCAACHTAVHLVMDNRAGKVRRDSRRFK